jgi:Type I phosphodiesterase / nucleotide pyrophosphatase
MNYARHIGRVGALAVTLGVGVAIATTPGIAYAEPSSSSTSTGASSSSSTSSSTDTSSTNTSGVGSDAVSTDKSDGADSSASDVDSPSNPADEPTVDRDVPADNDTADGVDDAEDGGEEREPTSGEGADEQAASGEGHEDIPPAADDEETPHANAGSTQDDAPAQDSASGEADKQLTSRSASAHTSSVPDASDEVDETTTAADSQTEQPQPLTFSIAADTDAPASTSTDAFTTAALTLTTPPPAPPQPAPSLVSIVSDFVAAVLNPLLSPGTGSPIQIPILTAVLAAMRDALERIFMPRTANQASQKTVALIADPPPQPLDPTDQHVLVIGVDGTNLSRILDDPENDNFFELMDTGTTAASSIVGHTTISNPSWTAVLTGEWGEKTGVINNVFTPWTYDTWPTVFNQLEAIDRDIETMTVANWDVINAISGAGSIPVDTNIFIPQIEGDTNWLATDDAVGAATVAAISGTEVPNFLFSYFVAVDENGHLYGGASPQYAEAIRNMDDNLGAIMDAVAAREAATGEDWTIIVTTDHGFQPQLGFGHGFQSPDETATFIIVDGPDFQDGYINQQYEIVDTTPTVVSLFGGTPRAGSDGVPLMTLGEGTDPVDLHQALRDAIAMNDYPDLVTNVALSLRTIFATVPYYVWLLTNDGTLPSPIGDVLYVATNIPAQIVARLTGVTGASIFPLFPPPPPDFGPSEEATLPDAILVCAAPGSAPGLCGEPSVA